MISVARFLCFVSWLRRSKAGKLWLVVTMLALPVALYWPAFSSARIWDDEYLVGTNPLFKSPLFLFEVFRHGLWGEFSAYYRPVQNLSYMGEYLVARDFIWLAHLSNTLIHGISALLLVHLVWGLPDLKRLKDGAADSVGLFVGFAWVLFPAHNAAVAYVSGRADSLAAMFALAGWLLCRRAIDCQGTWKKAVAGFGAIMCFLLAFCSKEIALAWVPFFFLAESRPGGLLKQHWRIICTGLLAAVTAYAWLRSLPHGPASVGGAGPRPWWFGSLLAAAAFGDYWRILVAPVRLTMERTVTSLSPLEGIGPWLRGEELWLVTLGLAGVFALWLACAWRAPGRDLRRLGALWFVVGFLPVSNLLPLRAQVAEHWIYHASIGWTLFIAGCALAVPRGIRCLAMVGGGVWLCCLAGRTWVRAHDWASASLFVESTIGSGVRTPTALGIYAVQLGIQKRYAEMEQVAREVIAREPGACFARASLAFALTAQGDEEQADAVLGALDQSLSAESRNSEDVAKARMRIAQWHEQKGRRREALRILDGMLKVTPDYWPAADLASQMLVRDGQSEAATKLLDQFTRRNWWQFNARFALGCALESSGNAGGAWDAFEFASKLDVHDPLSPVRLGQIALQKGDNRVALREIGRALKRNPSAEAPKRLLALVLRASGDPAKAQQVEAEIGSSAHVPGNL